MMTEARCISIQCHVHWYICVYYANDINIYNLKQNNVRS